MRESEAEKNICCFHPFALEEQKDCCKRTRQVQEGVRGAEHRLQSRSLTRVAEQTLSLSLCQPLPQPAFPLLL